MEEKVLHFYARGDGRSSSCCGTGSACSSVLPVFCHADHASLPSTESETSASVSIGVQFGSSKSLHNERRRLEHREEQKFDLPDEEAWVTSCSTRIQPEQCVPNTRVVYARLLGCYDGLYRAL